MSPIERVVKALIIRQASTQRAHNLVLVYVVDIVAQQHYPH